MKEKYLFEGLEIPKKFGANRYQYTLLKYYKGYSLYHQINKYGAEGYEIHKVRSMKECMREFKQPDGTIKEVITPRKIKMPNNGEFGTYGWSYQYKEKALEEFDKLIRGVKN